MSIPHNFDARRFEDAHQAVPLARWCGGSVVPGPWIVVPGFPEVIRPGHWIIKQADGTVRVEPPGNQDGYCADCGKPVWWQDVRLVTQDGARWCYGPDGKRFGMTHWHALSGMDQYIVPAAEGQPCYCLARDWPHVHLIVPVADRTPLPAGWPDWDPEDGSMPDGSLPH